MFTNQLKIASLDQLLITCLEKNLNFAAYRLPNTDNKELLVQKTSELHYLSEDSLDISIQGFLVAPFVYGDNAQAFLIKPDVYVNGSPKPGDIEQIDALESLPVVSNESHVPEEVGHDEYVKQISSITEKISQGNFEKVVLSRVKIIKGKYVHHLKDIFNQLCELYPNAFVYIFNAGPNLWVGATPEPLLKARNGSMHTVSLAGTRPLNEQNLNIGAWNSKERLEQEYVTRYITKVLSRFNLIDVELVGPYTKRAGNLVHLRTDFSFPSEGLRDKLGLFLSELHPTPAVCGMPRRESIELIQELEKHHREYYAGFLGPVGIGNELTIFVNLRCMKVLPDRLALFVGGGITADSAIEDEWLETEIKAETLLSVIRQIEK